LHGIARFKKNILYNEYEKIAKMMEKVKDFAYSYGVDLCLENVEWAYYNHVGFYREISKYLKGLKTSIVRRNRQKSNNLIFSLPTEILKIFKSSKFPFLDAKK
jgi:hypothetical protein